MQGTISSVNLSLKLVTCASYIYGDENMDLAHFLAWATVCLYGVVLFLFLRYFTWRHFANKHYWKVRPKLSRSLVERLAQAKGQSLPFISIMVPARDEARVIGNTIEHLAQLDYPADRYEILVVTDEKELLASEEVRKRQRQLGEPEEPTTQEVVEAKIKLIKERGTPAPPIRHYIVPDGFRGPYGGPTLPRSIPSTKGRALNYGMSFLNPGTQICGFYDAESRPAREVLLYVVYRWLKTDGKVKIWQGPVFQIRNFYQLGPINKVAALFQALSHEWYLPVLMQKLPFVGGTNLFVDCDLLKRVGGYDHEALTEDLELGVRSYLAGDAWPEYLPCASSEQTPPTYLGFFHQRLRWGSGHLQVEEKFQRADEYPWSKRRPLLRALFWQGQGQWLIYQFFVLLPLLFLPFISAGYYDPYLIPFPIRLLMRINIVLYYGFAFWLYFRYRRFIDFRVAPRQAWKRALAVSQLIFLPLGGFFFTLPFTAAWVLRKLHQEPKAWVKTPRTQEVPRWS